MGKYGNTKVNQNAQELKKLLSKYKEERPRKRIRMLMHLKACTYRTRDELAVGLGIGKRTLERWIHIYENKGVEALLVPISRNRKSIFISPQAHKELSQKLSDPRAPFISYVQIQEWLNTVHQSNIKYSNLYYYLKRNFGTKLKVPRKSNVKKDEEAVAFFKNVRGKD